MKMRRSPRRCQQLRPSTLAGLAGWLTKHWGLEIYAGLPNRKPESTFIKTETRDNCAAAPSTSAQKSEKILEKKKVEKVKEKRC